MAQLKTRIALRNDSSTNWLDNSDVVLLKGEVGIEFDDSGVPKIKIGDGFKKWSELNYFGGNSSGSSASQVFQAELNENETDLEAIARVVGTTILQEGDSAIVKATIAEKDFYTAYVYDNGSWAAMSGNYNAENVYFDEDLLTTTAIGNIELVNGQATIASTGKNLKEVWEAIFIKEQNPETIEPSVSFTASKTGSYESGTTVTPSYTVKLDPGSYTYGPETGITASSWTVQLRNGSTVVQTKNTSSDTFDDIVLLDGSNYTYLATADYEEGTIPVTNRGNNYEAGKIEKGSKSATKSSITCYRNTFYGTLTEKSEPTNEIIRGLSASGRGLYNGNSFDVTVPVGALRVIIAYPATLRDLTAVKDNNDSMSNIVSSFTKTTVSVKDASGDNGIDYKVYYIDYANANDTANKYSVTI